MKPNGLLAFAYARTLERRQPVAHGREHRGLCAGAGRAGRAGPARRVAL